jgi:hypothetical protein
MIWCLSALPGLPLSAAADPPREPKVMAVTGADGTLNALPGDSLAVQITNVVPSVLPEKGNVTLTGQVRNTSDVPWRNLKMYALMSSFPLTNAADLETAVESDPLLPIGERITTPGSFGSLDNLVPGQQIPFRLSIPRKLLPNSGPGAYWLGVQVLGETETGRDDLADGRARVLISIPPKQTAPRKVAVVVPLRAPFGFSSRGTITGAADWLEKLSPGGVLDRTEALSRHRRSGGLTWVIDPALFWAVSHLALGNEPRSLGQFVANQGPSSESSSVETGGLPQRANLWLNRAQLLTKRGESLSLLFGDIDVSAAVEFPDVLALAQERSDSALTGAEAALMPRFGLISPAGLRTTDPNTFVMLREDALRGEHSSITRVAGRRVVTAQLLDRNPTPGGTTADLSARQIILAHSLLESTREEPLVFTLRSGWSTPTPAQFFGGLPPQYVRLTQLGRLADTKLPTMAESDLRYPAGHARQRTPAENFRAAQRLLATAQMADSVINDEGAQLDQLEVLALGSLNTEFARKPNEVYDDIVRAESFVSSQLDRITVEGPRQVLLSSDSGQFSAVVTNGTNQQITVEVSASSTSRDVAVEGGRTVTLPPGEHASVKFVASATKLGISNVVVTAINAEGQAVGTPDEFPLRSGQVSEVIWWIMGAGASLLAIAIVLRLYRRLINRIKRMRASHAAEVPPEPVAERDPVSAVLTSSAEPMRGHVK